MKNRGVVGFLFNPLLTHVTLLRKCKPEWQKNRYNGPGGKVEKGETFEEAIEREFFEETGIEIKDWKLFYVKEYEEQNYVVHYFSAVSEKIWGLEFKLRLEPVFVICLEDLDEYVLIRDVRELIEQSAIRNRKIS